MRATRNVLNVVFAVLAVGSVPALAANPPTLINYQGVLRDAAGAPLDGDFDMVFRFYDDEAAGSEILVDEHLGTGTGEVTVSGGLFNAQLGGGMITDGSGPGTFASLADAFRGFSAVYLEIQVENETLSPRTRVLSSAYAINATRLVEVGESTIDADYVLTTSFADTGHEVTFTTLADERVNVAFNGRFSVIAGTATDLRIAYTIDNGPDTVVMSDYIPTNGGSDAIGFSVFTSPLAAGTHTIRLRAMKTTGSAVIKGASSATDSRLQVVQYR